MRKAAIFFDPSGRRARWLARAIVLGLGIPSLIFGLFLYDIWLGEPLTPLQIASDFRARAAMPPLTEPALATSAQPSLATISGPLTMAFYANWDDNSLPDLKKHLGQIDWLIPDWYSLQGKGMDLTPEIDENVLKLLHKSAHVPFVLPLLTNASDAGWDGQGLAALLANPRLRRDRIASLTNAILSHGFQGVVVQFAGIGPDRGADEITFLGELAQVLHKNHLLLATLRPLDTPVDRALGEICDMIIVQGAPPNLSAPLAPAPQVSAQLRGQLAHIPAQKLALTLGNYGRDWSRGGVQDLGFRDVMLRAQDHNTLPQFDRLSGSPVLRYTDQGISHEIWFTDAVSAQNILLAVQDVPLAGYAMWRLGSEDPTIWHALARHWRAKPDEFAKIPMADDVFLTGSGDLLRVTTAPVDGKRQITTTPLQWSARYETLAVPITVNRSGALRGAVSLTFDDGPDRRWTPQILDILATESAPATFFVTGANAAFAPDLLQRMIDEGHELGNHTFTHPNLATTSDAAAILEINGTQRLVEATVGRKMRMFRAPYVGDSEPATPAEIRPLILAQERGLIVVSLRADSHDWKNVTADQIVASVLAEVGTPQESEITNDFVS